MNVNEVVANRATSWRGKKLLHQRPRKHVPESSNDTFPTAMHIAAAVALEDKLLPAIDGLVETFRRLEGENGDVVKSGRTRTRTRCPSPWPRRSRLADQPGEGQGDGGAGAARPAELALGGTAVGTGLNAPRALTRPWPRRYRADG